MEVPEKYEQKYKDALERMKSWVRGEHPECFSEAQKAAEFIFPELAESEDERIKRILHSISSKMSSHLCDIFTDEEFQCFDAWSNAWLEKQGEQQTDKVEPKFKVGDWIILPLGIIARIDSINSTDYQVTTTDGKICDFKISKQDNYRLWTIEDAKDGDVLYSIDSKQPFIYKERPQFSQARGYCCINKFGEFAVWNTIKCVICTDKYIPATKEQRDALFAKMEEAGYKWDSKKKELKTIELKKLDSDKVIEWLNDQACQGWIEDVEVDIFVDKFKEDFGL